MRETRTVQGSLVHTNGHCSVAVDQFNYRLIPLRIAKALPLRIHHTDPPTMRIKNAITIRRGLPTRMGILTKRPESAVISTSHSSRNGNDLVILLIQVYCQRRQQCVMSSTAACAHRRLSSVPQSQLKVGMVHKQRHIPSCTILP